VNELRLEIANNKYLLHFANAHKVFTRKELIADLKSQASDNVLSTLSEQLDRLLKSNQIVRHCRTN